MVAFATFAALLASTASADVIGNVILQDYRRRDRHAGRRPGPQAEIRYQDQVSALDTVETGEGGATSMRFLDETRFDVGPNAMVKLDDFVFDPISTVGAGKISMAVGAFRYVGGKMKSDENVKLTTPTRHHDHSRYRTGDLRRPRRHDGSQRHQRCGRRAAPANSRMPCRPSAWPAR